MHVEDEETLLRPVDPLYKIWHNIQCVHLLMHKDETYVYGQLGSIAQRLNRTDFH